MSEIARLKGLFFWYFAYVGILSPYLSLYFRDAGFSVAQIGLLMTVPQVMRIVSPAFWGWLADRRGDVRLLLRASALLALLAVAAIPVATGAGLTIAAVALGVLSFSAGAQVPIGEALTLKATGGDAGGYGRVRLWGSIGFILGVVGVGAVLDRFGRGGLPGWMALALVGLSVSVWFIRSPVAQGSRAASARMSHRFREPAVIGFFLANALMIFAHAALYVLYSLLLVRHGYGETAIGLLWALGVIAEIILFRVQRPLFDWQPAVNLLVISLLVAALRFTVIGLADGALVILVVCQIAHAITFGLHHSAVMRVLHEWFDSAEQGRAQAAYLAISYGVGGSLGGLLLTRIWERVSPGAAFIVAGTVAALGAVIMVGVGRAVQQPGKTA
ncbi:MAG: MFS transporter [Burkholderiaceae bacterium]